jgi:hypothetical protein
VWYIDNQFSEAQSWGMKGNLGLPYMEGWAAIHMEDGLPYTWRMGCHTHGGRGWVPPATKSEPVVPP